MAGHAPFSGLPAAARGAGARKPVLFLHGTTSSAKANWSWNWDKALDARHWAHCDLDLPANGNYDIQVGAEYVVRAIKLMHQRADRKISIVGHSQGGMPAKLARMSTATCGQPFMPAADPLA